MQLNSLCNAIVVETLKFLAREAGFRLLKSLPVKLVPYTVKRYTGKEFRSTAPHQALACGVVIQMGG